MYMSNGVYLERLFVRLCAHARVRVKKEKYILGLRMLGKGCRSSRGITHLIVSVVLWRAEGPLLLLQTALRANEAPPVNILTLSVPQRTYGSMGPIERKRKKDGGKKAGKRSDGEREAGWMRMAV